MTATTSTKKVSYFGKRYRSNLLQNKKTLIIHIVLELLGLPVLAVIGILTCHLQEIRHTLSNEAILKYENSISTFAVTSIICLVICVFLGMVIALNLFSYLYKKSIADMHYSLPLNGTQRFFADYLSGFTIYMLPAIGGILLALAILGIATPAFPLLDQFWKVFPLVLKLTFIALFTMILFYTLAVLAITFCGNTFEAIFSIVAFNALIPATTVCTWFALCNGSSYGMVEDAILYKNIFTSTSPIGSAFFVAFNALGLGFNPLDFFSNSLVTKWFIFTSVVILIYLLAAWLLYIRRKAEDISKPYVYKSFFYGVMTMAVFCVLSLFISSDSYIGAGIMLCAIFWFIMEVITRRGFRKFWQAGIGFVAAVVSVLLVCKGFAATNGFGMTKSVPSASSVECVALAMNEIPGYQMSFKDKAVIEETIKLHEELVDRHFNSDNYSYQSAPASDNFVRTDTYIAIYYSTSSGSVMARRYTLPSGMASELCKKIFLSDDYAKTTTNTMFEFYFNNDYYTEHPDRITIDFNDKANNTASKIVTIDDLKKIRTAYYNDLTAMTEDDLLNAEYYGTLDYDYFVLSTFENTISLLDSFGIEVGRITADDLHKNVFFDNSAVYVSESKRMFENKEYDEFYEDYYYPNEIELYLADSITNTTVMHGSNFDYIAAVDDITIELLNRSGSLIFGELPIAAFTINGRIVYLLDRGDNKELLEKLVYEKSHSEETNYGEDAYIDYEYKNY